MIVLKKVIVNFRLAEVGLLKKDLAKTQYTDDWKLELPDC